MMSPPLVALLLLCGANIAAAQLSADASGNIFYTALYDYTGESAAGTLSLTAGEALVVTNAETGGWLTGYRTREPETVGTFPASYAEPATSDATPLRDFAAGSTDDKTATWTAGTSPCGDGWNSWGTGWLGVTCCRNGVHECGLESENQGRVKYVGLRLESGVRGDLAHLASLTYLTTLDLLATNAHGDIAALLGLSLLRTLILAETLVYGDAAALRDGPSTVLPDWYPTNNCGYTPCSDFASCPAGTSPSVGGADAVGADACACCDGSSMVRNSTTGACVCTTDAACGLDFVCSSGSCVVPRALFLRDLRLRLLLVLLVLVLALVLVCSLLASDRTYMRVIT
eukprot:COSAG03_NODE_456_length_7759_cov_122.878068_10_plen_343_part_00